MNNPEIRRVVKDLSLDYNVRPLRPPPHVKVNEHGAECYIFLRVLMFVLLLGCMYLGVVCVE